MGSISRIHVCRLRLFPITSDKGTYTTSLQLLADYTFLGKTWQRVLEGWKHKSTSDQELEEEGAGNEANIP